MFQRFGGLKNSQNTWFTPCFNASKRSKPRKIRDSRHVSMLRSAQNPAKYVIHAVSQRFGWLRTSQNMWFTQGCNASNCSKPCKIRDSRHVSTVRRAQNFAKYVIHARFQCFELLNTRKICDSRRVSTLGGLRTSQNMWSTQGCNAANSSKLRIIRDSRRVSMLRSA